MSLFPGLREIASIQERVLRLQDKVEHPSLYCTEQDAEAGTALLRHMQSDLETSQGQLRDTDIQGKLTRICSDISDFSRMRESMQSRYRRAEERLVEMGFAPPARPPVFPLEPTNPFTPNNARMDASFIKEVPSNINLPVISPSPIPVAPPEPEELLRAAVTPELFRKLIKQSSAGADHIKAVMGSSASSIETCPRNEPARDMLMTLAGPIRAERHIPPPLAESPVCLREFKFPATPTQSGATPSRLNTPQLQAPGATSNLVTAHSRLLSSGRREQRYNLITESQYSDLPSYIVKHVSLSEMNTTLTRFREIAQEPGAGSREVGQLSDQELADEVGSVSKLSLVKLALQKLKLIQLVPGEEAVYLIH